ncbi:MAG: rod-binding protein [Firmicutes bacterium]|nr:rod-binding protein [Bacillota bacterium]
MQIEGITPQPINQAVNLTPSKVKEEAKLKETCQQFESLFLTQLFAQMRKSIPKTELFGSGKDEELYNGMMDEERAKAWSQADGIGLANVLYQQLKQTL